MMVVTLMSPFFKVVSWRLFLVLMHLPCRQDFPATLVDTDAVSAWTC